MNISGLDPSIALGFFCKDENDLDDLVKKLKQVRFGKTFLRNSLQLGPVALPSLVEFFRKKWLPTGKHHLNCIPLKNCHPR